MRFFFLIFCLGIFSSYLCIFPCTAFASASSPTPKSPTKKPSGKSQSPKLPKSNPVNPIGLSTNLFFKVALPLDKLSLYPQLYDVDDLQLIKTMVTLLDKRQFTDYKNAMDSLGNPVLRGYFLFYLYQAQGYKPSPSELRAWLKENPDYPLIYTKAIHGQLKLLVSSKDLPPAPKTPAPLNPIYKFEDFFENLGYAVDLSDASDSIAFDSSFPATYGGLNATISLEKSLNAALRKGKTLEVKRILSDSKTIKAFPPPLYAFYASQLAHSYFLDGQDSDALIWGKKSIIHGGDLLANPWFTMGLVYWRLGQDADSERYFSILASPKYTKHMRIAGAYWAARTALRQGKIADYEAYLAIAATAPSSFYGALAIASLGIPWDVDWNPLPANANAPYLLNAPHGRRALALLQLGIVREAEEELYTLSQTLMQKDSNGAYRLSSDVHHHLLQAILFVSQDIPLPMLSYRLGGYYAADHGLFSLSYPITPWSSLTPHRIDLALTNALVRRESNFNPRARSHVGAGGMMQLMPGTATMVSKRLGKQHLKPDDLENPLVNLELGQYYVGILLGTANRNLIYTIAGWNGGYLHVQRWNKETHRLPQSDPLFFIESIPFKETRLFTKAVLLDYWIYQHQLDQPPTTLYDLAQNKHPIYDGHLDMTPMPPITPSASTPTSSPPLSIPDSFFDDVMPSPAPHVPFPAP